MFKILLVGSGHMGKSLLKGWLNSKIKNISIIDPKVGKNKKKLFKLDLYDSLNKLKNIDSFNVIFFAVKPQIVDKVLKNYKTLNLRNKLIISIIAGKDIKYFEKNFGSKTSIIRTMPNLPASISKGITCLYGNQNVSLKQKKFALKLFNSVGKTFWVKNESFINKFTAISGSGPAYYYFFIENLTSAAKKIGIDKKLAYEISKETAIGSIDLLRQSEDNAETLRKNIAVKGGTTEAAINSFRKNDNMKKIVFSGVNSAYKRAIKLGKK